MRILLISTQLGHGGAESQVASLAHAFSSLGHKVAIVTLLSIIEVPLPSDVAVIDLSLSKRRPWSLICGWVRFIRFYDFFRPDIVHSHAAHANFFARLSRLFLKFPVLICTAHNTIEGGAWVDVIYRHTDRLCDLTTNVSERSTLRYIEARAAPADRIRTVPNGIDLSEFVFDLAARSKFRSQLQCEASCLLMVAVGRLSPQKDFVNLIRAVSLAHQEGLLQRRWKLVIAGKGPQEELLRDEIRRANLLSRVILLGHCDKVSELMSAADLVVVSSLYEGFSLVIAEAMACERPVISTDCGGLADILHPSMVSPPGDAEALSRLIGRYAATDATIRRELGQHNRAIVVSNFGIQAVSAHWLAIYKEFHC